ncbi:MAG: hypothetical protein DWQ01_13860 [Planctomycetota bacterium]|nr:MAG: hypothetical protein DWQ01_13860 [Planctomycetota bacterium]
MIATAGILLFALAGFQEPESGDFFARREADFARALTLELGFDQLAEEVLQTSMEASSSKAGRSELLLALCDVRRLAAARAQILDERLEMLGSAAEAYREFLDSSSSLQQIRKARNNLTLVVYNYGQTLQDLFISLGVDEEQRKGFLEQGDPIFQSGLEACNELINDYQSLEEGEAKEAAANTLYRPALFYRSLIYFYWGLVSQPGSVDRREYMRRASDMLESFAIEVGQGSIAGLRAFKYMGDVYLAQESPDDAEIYYDYVIENAVPEDWEERGMTPSEVDGRRNVSQEGFLGKMLMYGSQGLTRESLQLGETFLTWEVDNGVLLSDDGYRVLLRYAEALTDSGAIGEAIDQAQRVQRENSGKGYLILEAREVLQSIIAAAPPEAEFDLTVLYDAAKGAYDGKRFENAISLFQLLIQRMGNTRQAERFGAQAYYYLGRSWMQTNHLLEAGVAFELGFDQFPDDPDFADRNARGWVAIAEPMKNRVRGDQALENWYQGALDAVKSASGGNTPEALLWRKAKDDYDKAQEARRNLRGKEADAQATRAALAAYDQAVRSMEQIQRSNTYYENALVHIGLSHYHKMNWDTGAAKDAFKAFNDYIEKFIPNPQNTPSDAQGRRLRKNNWALADYYRGQVRLRQAKSGRRELFEDVLDLYEGYLERHPEQGPQFGAATLKDRVDAFIALGRIDEAIAEYEKLVSSNLSRTFQRLAAISLYQYYRWRMDQTADDEAAQQAARKEAANYLSVANQLDPNPSLVYKYVEANLRADLGEHSTATQLLESILRKFKGTPELEQRLYNIEMDLVEAYLAQDKTGPANDIVQRYLNDPKSANKIRVISNSVKVLGGYPLLREGRIVHVPGQESTEAFKQAEELVSILVRLAESDQEFPNKFDNPDYWTARAAQAYLYYKRAAKDSTYKGKHRNLIESMRRLAPDLGAAVAPKEVPEILNWLLSQP